MMGNGVFAAFRALCALFSVSMVYYTSAYFAALKSRYSRPAARRRALFRPLARFWSVSLCLCRSVFFVSVCFSVFAFCLCLFWFLCFSVSVSLVCLYLFVSVVCLCVALWSLSLFLFRVSLSVCFPSLPRLSVCDVLLLLFVCFSVSIATERDRKKQKENIINISIYI